MSVTQGYQGNIMPKTACEWLEQSKAVLIDVRTAAECEWVGFVAQSVFLPWKLSPDMNLNPHFDEGILAIAQKNPQKPLMFLCRSGARSMAAAKRATELGCVAYNISEGFEGDLDENAHRGNKNGWRFHGLPWKQT